MTTQHNREAIADGANPLGLDGIEYIEYATSKPQALGQVLEMMGFRPIARHRSREVTLYHQGRMNIIVNAHVSVLPRAAQPAETPVISALALRVRSAAAAYRHVIERGAGRADARGGDGIEHPRDSRRGRQPHLFRGSLSGLLDLRRGFHADPDCRSVPPALAGMRFFGVVQYIGADRMEDWTEFYTRLFAFGRCLANASAFCPKAASCAVHAVCFTCN